jgi:3D (Asp-Asp-Asp) domain-containing protein
MVYALLLALLVSCSSVQTQSLEVTATAYTSFPAKPIKTRKSLGAWGDELEPGVMAIAVSRDLLQKGLDYNTEVTIEGLPGTYRVLDKMHGRWKNKIDIYMGNDIQAAKNWGKRKVVISWQVKEP